LLCKFKLEKKGVVQYKIICGLYVVVFLSSFSSFDGVTRAKQIQRNVTANTRVNNKTDKNLSDGV